MPTHPLILASGSPRRRDLLQAMGATFEVRAPQVEELTLATAPRFSAGALAAANARMKGRSLAQKYPQAHVLAADTVVALGARIFGKPRDLAEAAQFLADLSGRTHEVVTAVILFDPGGKSDPITVTSRVTFHPLTPEIIQAYLVEVAVLDKAGGYSLQEKGDRLVQRVEGSRTNVIGLPTESLLPLLKARGLLCSGSTPVFP